MRRLPSTLTVGPLGGGGGGGSRFVVRGSREGPTSDDGWVGWPGGVSKNIR